MKALLLCYVYQSLHLHESRERERGKVPSSTLSHTTCNKKRKSLKLRRIPKDLTVSAILKWEPLPDLTPHTHTNSERWTSSSKLASNLKCSWPTNCFTAATSCEDQNRKGQNTGRVKIVHLIRTMTPISCFSLFQAFVHRYSRYPQGPQHG